MALNWDDLRLFLAVARLGGLTAATQATRLSAATLGRRLAGLERALGESLFVRAATGYSLTAAGKELFQRAVEVESAMVPIARWRYGVQGERTVRISAGPWTTDFLTRRISALWRAGEGIGIEFVAAANKVDIGRRNADIGIRRARPTERWLAGRRVGGVAYALYSGRHVVNGVEAGLFVGFSGSHADLPSARWLEAHHGDRIAVRANELLNLRELVADGAGIGVFPCFSVDRDPRLVRISPHITELASEQWLVMHHEGRSEREVRLVSQRIARLMHDHRPLFRGDERQIGVLCDANEGQQIR